MSQSSNFSSTTVHLQKSHNIHFSPSSALAHRVYKRSQSPVQNSYHTKLPTELPTSHTQTKTPYKTPYQTPLSTLQQTPTQQQATLTPTTKCPAQATSPPKPPRLTTHLHGAPPTSHHPNLVLLKSRKSKHPPLHNYHHANSARPSLRNILLCRTQTRS
jgi:hypothetical protein